MTFEILSLVIIDVCTFFCLSEDDVISPDAAVEQIERIAAKLKGLTINERQAFCDLAIKVAEREEDDLGESVRTEFLRSLPECLGLRS